MKITRNTPEQLIVANVPWIIGVGLIVFILVFVGIGLSMVISGELWGLFFGLFGGGMGALFFVLMVRRTQVIFDRGSGHITIRTRSVFGFSETRRELAHLARAELERSRGKNGDVYRPVLIFQRRGAETPLPLVQVATNFGGHGRVVEAINAWLDAGELDSDAEAP